MNIKTFKKAMLLIFSVLLLGQFQEAFPQKVSLEPAKVGSTPTIYTEKGAYNYGDVVKIMGSNFVPFDTIIITVRRSDVADVLFIGESEIAEWIGFADEKGSIESVWTISLPGARFEVQAYGKQTGLAGAGEFNVLALAGHLDQCRNGTNDVTADCTGANWTNGDLNGSQAHYIETEAVPYRMIMTNVTPGLHSITIEWDTTQGGHHAIDYIETFNRTEPTANPCSDVAGCNPATYSSHAIPIDPGVTKGFDGILGTADDIVQNPGEFRLFGGVITTVSGYTMTGSYADASQTRITVNFTATGTGDLVLAWGGHISSRQDWGTNNSTIAIGGAPYHMRIYDLDGGGGGNQDRSLQGSAVFYPGKITVIKDAQPDSIVPFLFTVLGPGVTDFTLDDNGTTTDTYSNTASFGNLINFGAGHTVTITESAGGGYWALTSLVCTSDPNGGAGTNNNVISLPGKYVEIFLEEGEFVTCTFTNSVITAAPVMIEGRVTDANGNGIRNAVIHLTGISGSDALFARTNPFGYYRIDNVPNGETCVVTVTAKGYVFKVPSLVLTPMDNTGNVNFQAAPE